MPIDAQLNGIYSSYLDPLLNGRPAFPVAATVAPAAANVPVWPAPPLGYVWASSGLQMNSTDSCTMSLIETPVPAPVDPQEISRQAIVGVNTVTQSGNIIVSKHACVATHRAGVGTASYFGAMLAVPESLLDLFYLELPQSGVYVRLVAPTGAPLRARANEVLRPLMMLAPGVAQFTGVNLAAAGEGIRWRFTRGAVVTIGTGGSVGAGLRANLAGFPPPMLEGDLFEIQRSGPSAGRVMVTGAFLRVPRQG